MYIRQGGDILILSQLLGHADITITYKTYIHIIDEQKEQAVSRLNNLHNPYL
jgi:integrase